jgi:hypothetical protein
MQKSETANPPDIHELLKLHLEAWGRLAELIGICTTQRDAGNLKVGQRTFVHVQRLLDEVRALEGDGEAEAALRPQLLLFPIDSRAALERHQSSLTDSSSAQCGAFFHVSFAANSTDISDR